MTVTEELGANERVAVTDPGARRARQAVLACLPFTIPSERHLKPF